MYDKKATYGSSLILREYMQRKFKGLPIDIIYFVSFQEFEKYMRLTGYGIKTTEVINEILDDIRLFSSYQHTDYSAILRNWIIVNFSHMEAIIEEGLNNET